MTLEIDLPKIIGMRMFKANECFMFLRFDGIDQAVAPQNVGMSEVIWFHVWNNRPRVIWVPDDYRKIQEAINASEDGDTVRVRPGMYQEGIMISKRLWLESELGPEETVIDAAGYGFGIYVSSTVRDTVESAIRGFTIRNSDSDGIYILKEQAYGLLTIC